MAKSVKVFMLPSLGESGYRRLSGPLWEPAADIYRTPEGWKIKFDLAGIRPDDIEVLVADNKLIVRGLRRDSFITKGWSYHQLEITYSRFERVLSIPCELAGSRIRSEYKDGWLVIHLESKE
ncbi:MAG TPA: Hsp20/alpha crystallin family protein [Blastocatellia bacterium]